jgi:hypothetical protein
MSVVPRQRDPGLTSFAAAAIVGNGWSYRYRRQVIRSLRTETLSLLPEVSPQLGVDVPVIAEGRAT